MHQPRTRRIAQPLLRRAQAGVTLVETTVVTSVLAVVTSLAVPSFQDAVQRRHLEGAVRESIDAVAGEGRWDALRGEGRTHCELY